MRIHKRLSVLFPLAVLIVFVSASGTKEEAEIILKAERENRPIPVLARRYPELSIEEAYDIQAEYVRMRLMNDKIAGFKAGLTSDPVQKKFGIDGPVWGVLFSSGMYEGSPVIEVSKFRNLMIETEIGFIVGRPIREKIPDTVRLKEHISAVVPVIELPEFGFSDLKQLVAQDIIAANVGSAAFIAGDQKPLLYDDLDGITVELVCDGKALYQGRGSDVLGGQWETLLRLVNSVVGHGWAIESRNILITGSLGKVVPAKPGRCEAKFGELGNVSFEIK